MARAILTLKYEMINCPCENVHSYIIHPGTKVMTLPEISDAHYVFLTRQCKRPLIFRARVH